MKKIIFLLTLLGGILAHSSCNRCQDPRNPDCCNYDPCIDEYATSAYFEIEEFVYDTYFPSDTLYGRARFHAKSGMNSYQWRVGTDPRVFTDSVFTLSFSNSPGTYDIRLITTHTPNANCFPDDDGIDTFHRTLVVLPDDTLHPTKMSGKWFGAYDDDPTDTLTLSFKVLQWQQAFSERVLLNFPAGCDGGRIVNDNLMGGSQRFGYRHFRHAKRTQVSTGLGCNQASDATASIDLNNTLRIKILLWPVGTTANDIDIVPIERHFTAHRIQ